MSASAESIDRYHREVNGWSGIGYHFYVRKSGEVVRGRPEDMQGAHTLNFNDVSLGICFEGNFELEEMGEKQLSSGLELCRELLGRYPEAQIFYHKDFNNTACPGKNFPVKAFNKISLEEQLTEDDYENFKLAFSRFEGEKKLSPLPAWAQEEYGEAVSLGITDGTEPCAFVTRAEAALMAKRAAMVRR